MLQQDEPGDYVVATGETHSVRELLRDRLRPRRARLGGPRRRSTRGSSAPPRSTCSSATRPRPRRCSAGSRRTSFEDLVTMMVDADIELLSGQARGASADHASLVGRRRRRPAAGRARPGRPARRRSPRSSTSATTSSCTGCTSAPTSTRSPTRWPAPSTPSAAGACAGETWQAMEALGRYRRRARWFSLGDRDLGHPPVPHRPAAGGRAAVRRSPPRSPTAWGLGLRLLPVTDDRVRTTRSPSPDEGEIGFQEYFVQRHHDVAVSRPCASTGAEAARPGPGRARGHRRRPSAW